jgi:hypothetical protein
MFEALADVKEKGNYSHLFHNISTHCTGSINGTCMWPFPLTIICKAKELSEINT